MKRKISFIALLIAHFKNALLQMDLRGLAWLDQCSLQCPRPSTRPSFPREEKQIETIKKLRGRAWRATHSARLLHHHQTCQTRNEKAFRRIGSRPLPSSPSSPPSSIPLRVGKITQQKHWFIPAMVFPFANVCPPSCKYEQGGEKAVGRWRTRPEGIP